MLFVPADSERFLAKAGQRGADALGDVTAPVIAEFYRRYPEAQASFAHHMPGNPASLEAEMVGNTLYYVMTWFEKPVEARIAFDSSVPQHRVALGVPPDWYRGFIDAFLDVVEPAAVETALASARQYLAASSLPGAALDLLKLSVQ